MTEASHNPLLSVRGLTQSFSSGRRLGRARGGPSRVLRDVGFDLEQGECLAVVGESGAGKTTLARSLLRLVEPDSGEVLFRGRDVLRMNRQEMMDFRRKAQIVFQDPFGSLNPRLRAGPMLREVLRVHGGPTANQNLEARVVELLKMVGLHSSHAHRFPHEFSGGQRQRLGIARALSVEPELLVLDEPVSALDLSVQAQILGLLDDLRKHLDLTLIFIAHDLGVVRHVADRVTVMYSGRMMEVSPSERLFRAASHPYTRGLLTAAGAGSTEPSLWAGWEILPGSTPSPSRPLSGCAFHPRCPHPEKDDECSRAAPELKCLSAGHHVACWKESKGTDRG